MSTMHMAGGDRKTFRMIRTVARHRQRSNANQREPDRSALAGCVTRRCLVDDVDPALAADQLIVTMAGLQGLERVLDLHFSTGNFPPTAGAPIKNAPQKRAGNTLAANSQS